MRKFKNLDGAVFQNERGLLTSNAFEVLNHTFSKKYGRCKLFKEAVSLVSENFAIIEDNNRKNHYGYNREYVIEHFNKMTKMYYELLKRRKKIDYKEKLDNINKDF
jgi:hypothetical protein